MADGNQIRLYFGCFYTDPGGNMKSFKLIIVLLCALAAPLLNAAQVDDGLDVAELIIQLSQSITSDLHPPAVGAERQVTSTTVTEEGHLRVYYIQGKDVYRTGRVLNTFTIRLQKWIASQEDDFVSDGTGRELDETNLQLISALLNSLYDIAEMDLSHDKVELKFIGVQNSATETPLVYELEGINRVCEHDELNSFKITVSRHEEPRGTWYEVSFVKPYSPVHIGA